MPEARFFHSVDLKKGLRAEFERGITGTDVEAFAALSGDGNPLHIDEGYARKTNYGKRIVHGAFQVALASAMAGMHLPGREVVVGGFQCRFPAPLFYPSRVRVEGEIVAWDPQSGHGILRVRVEELTSLTVTAEIHVGFALHETRKPRTQEEASPQPPDSDERPIVLVTGAGGGLGTEISALLAKSWHVLGLGRSPCADRTCGPEDWISADLASDDWESVAGRALRGRKLYGVVHAAWPSASAGSLLETELEAVKAQLEFGGTGTIRVAQFLRTHAEPSGARLIVLGTTAATVKPVLNLASYSLGKAVAEHTVRLLAPELARRNITINTLAPSFVPAGMNSSKTSRMVLAETAKVPLGRLSRARTSLVRQSFCSLRGPPF